ncbi:MAG: mechanosensitive ion channel domain-containing protein [Planctomycetota bacterium]
MAAPTSSAAQPERLTDALSLTGVAWWAIAVVALLAALLALNWVLLVRPKLNRAQMTRRRFVMLGLTLAAVLIAVLRLPIEMSARLGILQLLALAGTALITLSSTTIAANFMAGLMLGRVRSFRNGDFVRVGESFGRVSERGLFHVEIQTEDRDLVTLPNAYMITQPVRVVRQSGTIVSCELSLGYDLAHGDMEPLLVRAASASGLVEPYVQVLALGDFSVTYRVCGFLGDVKKLISARSALRASVLDTLHGAGVEIVSPSFMNQRPTPDPVIPTGGGRRKRPSSAEPEAIVFDKADEAERLGGLRIEADALRAKIKALGVERGSADETRKTAIDDECAELEAKALELEAEAREMESTAAEEKKS